MHIPFFRQCVAIIVLSGICGSVLGQSSKGLEFTLVTQDQLKHWWLPTEREEAEWPNRALQARAQGCVAVGYLIRSDGSTSNHRVIAMSPEEIFNESALQAARTHKYVASKDNPDKNAVFTYNVFTFRIQWDEGSNDGSKAQGLADLCTTSANQAFRQMEARKQGGG